MREGTRDGTFKDVNRKQHDFFRDNVVIVGREENSLVKQIKIDRWKKLVGWHEESKTTYADRLKTEKKTKLCGDETEL